MIMCKKKSLYHKLWLLINFQLKKRTVNNKLWASLRMYTTNQKIKELDLFKSLNYWVFIDNCHEFI